MEKYLLNKTTGVICIDGTSENDVLCDCELLEVKDGFKLVGSTSEGEEVNCFLSTENYFDGKEFNINNITSPKLETKKVYAHSVKIGDQLLTAFGIDTVVDVNVKSWEEKSKYTNRIHTCCETTITTNRIKEVYGLTQTGILYLLKMIIYK